MSDSPSPAPSPPGRLRNTAAMVAASSPHLAEAVAAGLMQVDLQAREGKIVTLPGGQDVVEFVNCSYLGLDTHPAVIAAAQATVAAWGVHLCCARSRFTIAPNAELEAALAEAWGGRAITFPSVTAAHLSALPLAAAGVLRGDRLGASTRPLRGVFDRQAHASMQFLRPVLAAEAEVVTIGHNDMDALLAEVRAARTVGAEVLYVCDGVYSMGGAAPIRALSALAEAEGFWIYVDDAHGTSIYGERGEGYVLSQLGGRLPPRMLLTFSLAKGFGTNGGGVLVPGPAQEAMVRAYGMSYAFSGPLDFAIAGAALASLALHRDGTVARLQARLWDRVRRFWGGEPPGDVPSPIAMVPVGRPADAIAAGVALRDRGYFVSVAFFPVVPRDQAQLRIAITAEHSPAQVEGLRAALTALGLSPA